MFTCIAAADVVIDSPGARHLHTRASSAEPSRRCTCAAAAQDTEPGPSDAAMAAPYRRGLLVATVGAGGCHLLCCERGVPSCNNSRLSQLPAIVRPVRSSSPALPRSSRAERPSPSRPTQALSREQVSGSAPCPALDAWPCIRLAPQRPCGSALEWLQAPCHSAGGPRSSPRLQLQGTALSDPQRRAHAPAYHRRGVRTLCRTQMPRKAPADGLLQVPAYVLHTASACLLCSASSSLLAAPAHLLPPVLAQAVLQGVDLALAAAVWAPGRHHPGSRIARLIICISQRLGPSQAMDRAGRAPLQPAGTAASGLIRGAALQ